MVKRYCLILLIGILIPVSCRQISGGLNVFKKLSFDSENGVVFIKPGYHLADLKLQARKFSFTLKSRDKDKKIYFNVPKNTKLPKSGETLRLSGDSINSKYDIIVKVKIRENFSPQVEENKRCSMQRVIAGENMRIWGKRRVKYRYQYKMRDIIINMVLPETNDIVAEFTGSDVGKRIINDFTGECDSTE